MQDNTALSPLQSFGCKPQPEGVQNAQARHSADRVFYLSIPPSIFTDVAAAVSAAAASPNGYTRVIVEKPFGKDRCPSSPAL